MENTTWNIVGTSIVMEYAMRNIVGTSIVMEYAIRNIVGTSVVSEIQASFRPAGGGGIEGECTPASVGNILMEQNCLGRLEKLNPVFNFGLKVTTLLLFRIAI